MTQHEDQIQPEQAGIDSIKLWMNENQEALLAAGVTRVSGEWSGYGDEGSFNGVGNDGIYEVPDRIASLVEDVCWQRSGGDFSINGEEEEGGRLLLDIAQNRVVYESWYETRELVHQPDTVL